ncbi:VLP3p-6 [Venturia canescens]|uniref:VLP3p-6 n=1 Tax=Venturia canescens TaxID=32260 RepID=A0ACB9ZHI1_9HYME|nr:neprilysin-2-like [Venturia canescens]KAI5630581.1 VLP3p-6 [Venturia canescens]
MEVPAAPKTDLLKRIFIRNDSENGLYRRSIRNGLWIIAILAFIVCLACVLMNCVIITKFLNASSLPVGMKISTPGKYTEIVHFVDTLSDNLTDVCFEPECIKAASSILMKMDHGTKPCDDFYKFACGSFLNSTIIPDDKDSITSFTALRDQVAQQLRWIIEEQEQKNVSNSVKLVKNLYNSCMDKGMIEARGLEPLKNTLKTLGGWPVIDGPRWDESAFDWVKAIEPFRKVGHSTNLINLKIITDPKNATRHVIALDQPSLGLSRKHLIQGLQGKAVNDYYNYMVDIATILGASKRRAMNELRESLLFEIELARINVPKENLRDASKLYNPMNLVTLEQNYPRLRWREYLENSLSEKVHVNDEELIVLAVPQYIAHFDKLIAVTSKRTQANYMMWRVVKALIVFLNDRISKRHLFYTKSLNGRSKPMPRWKECVKIVSQTLPVNVGALYVKKYFNEAAKKNVVDMVMNIKQEFEKTLEKAEWLDEKTRRNALEKSDAMTHHVAYPNEILDDKKIIDEMKDLELSQNHYFENILKLKSFKIERAHVKLRKLVDPNDWMRHGRAAVVNAFYSPDENSIQLPAAILQGAFFNHDRPKYMNYGGIGFIIGHEITHGFDDRGRQFDKNGNLFDWWEGSAKDKYLKLTRCIIDQYANYTAEQVGLHVNGVLTQGENIADNGGAKLSYHAYQNWIALNGPEKKLPGLPYTPRQMFWISMASAWCSKYKNEQLALRINEDYHSPAEYRILGTLSNIREFSEDFHCLLGSRMNPVHKCIVW